MRAFATTGATAGWLLGRVSLLDAFHQTLFGDPESAAGLESCDFAEGPARLSFSGRSQMAVFWNVDYASAAADEVWGVVDLSDVGLKAKPEISRETLERALYVLSQRAQGLLIDGAFIHRSWGNGIHTCVAGHGDAWNLSLGYREGLLEGLNSAGRALAITGPEWDHKRLVTKVEEFGPVASLMLNEARAMKESGMRKPLAGPELFARLREVIGVYVAPVAESEYDSVSVAVDGPTHASETFRTTGWSYADWTAQGSSLSSDKRALLDADAFLQHPVRITGPAGSGKTLLMQLLAVKRARLAKSAGKEARILYLVHNEKMADMVRQRFETLLLGEPDLSDALQLIETMTLSQYATGVLELAAEQIIGVDAQSAKDFQLSVLADALSVVLSSHSSESPFFQQAVINPDMRAVLLRLIATEISVAIKGHGLEGDSKRYVESEQPLSRLHGLLSPQERRFVFEVFRVYHQTMFGGYQVLDSDDVALSLLGRLRTPIWRLQRQELGYDHVFVDEAQLFNQNERHIFAQLTRTNSPYVPVVLALDQAQDINGQVTAGLAALGIEDAANERLESVHRSTEPVVRLAFFIIQRSTDLFSEDFPDFTRAVSAVTARTPSGVEVLPVVERMSDEQSNYGKAVLKRIRAMRRGNLWRIAVVCMAERYWQPVLQELRKSSDLPLHVLEHRGERLPVSEPVVALSRPTHVGGQEFDAVLLVGAEEGIAPPRVLDNEPLAAVVEQQSLREYYLAVSRAKSQVVVLLEKNAILTPVLSDAVRAGLMKAEQR